MSKRSQFDEFDPCAGFVTDAPQVLRRNPKRARKVTLQHVLRLAINLQCKVLFTARAHRSTYR